MKSVIKSVSPEICEKLSNGDCKIFISKTAPKCEVPFKGYIYATKAKKWFHSGIILTSNELLWLSNGKIKMCDGFELWADGEDYQCVNGKVIGEFICDEVEKFSVGSLRCDDIEKLACLSYREMINYFYKPEELDGKTSKMGYAWHISDLKIYEKPRELREFSPICSYKNDDGSCQYRKVDCLYQQRDYNTDGSVNLVTCGKPITRVPSNWQYVEEL